MMGGGTIYPRLSSAGDAHGQAQVPLARTGNGSEGPSPAAASTVPERPSGATVKEPPCLSHEVDVPTNQTCKEPSACPKAET